MLFFVLQWRYSCFAILFMTGDMRLFLSESEAPALELTHLIKKELFFISLYSIFKIYQPCSELFDTTLLDPFKKRFELCWICWINC